MHPPFGFALFFLRSVAPEKPYVDRVTKKVMEPVTTMQIYKGAIPFLIIQLTMVGILIAFPQLVTGSLDKKVEVNMESISDQMRDSLSTEDSNDNADPGYGADEKPDATAPAPEAAGASTEDDPLKAMQDALKADKKK